MENYEAKIKHLIIKACRLKLTPDEIDNDMLLFSKEGLNLDSVDALQLVVAIGKEFNIDVPESDFESLITVNKIAEFLNSYTAATA